MELGTPHRDSSDDDDFDRWIAAQTERSIAAMELAISATPLTRRRDDFSQIIVPSRGSVLASVAIGDWNPDPDYFFHWIRDSAIVMRTVAELCRCAATVEERNRWQGHFEDFARFSLKLTAAAGAYDAGYAAKTQPDQRKHLRNEAELRALHGDALLGEPRFNADGTLDVLQWSRPQYDGPALRALACLRFIDAGAPITDELRELLRIDLDFTRRHAGEPCVGPWEEDSTRHYYVALVQLGALVHGRQWAQEDATKAERELKSRLDAHWSKQQGVFAATTPVNPRASRDGLLDASCLLAILDADLPEGPHSVMDPRVHATQHAIENLFAQAFPINRTIFRGRAPALGRYSKDKYFGGGAWFPTTLAAATLHYRRAQIDAARRKQLIDSGDAFLKTVRELIPPDGSVPEQVDSSTGKPTSARHLTWSYAAFIGAALAREKARDASDF